MPRLSSQALYALRNHINIDRLITQVLQMPIQQRDGRVRFQCPLCARFHTATHPNTNLARCFECEKNFNTIELVMAVHHIPFLEAVALLQRDANSLAPGSRPAQPQPAQPQPTHTDATSHLIAIKQILSRR